MSTCCVTPYFLGCFNHCGAASFGIASETTTLTGIFTFAGIDSYQEIPIVITEPIQIDLSGLNEYALYELTLYDSDGNLYPVDIDGTEYDCFRFKTKVVYGQRLEPSPTPETCCDPVIIEVDPSELSYVIQASEWASFGQVPTIEVFTDDGTGYTLTTVQPQYDSFPNPTSITVSIPFAAVAWYIKLS